MEKNDMKVRDVMDSNSEASKKLKEIDVAYNNLESNLFKTNITLQPVVKLHKVVADSTENLSVMDEDGKTNDSREIVVNVPNVMDEVQIADQIKPDKGSIEALTQGNVIAKKKRRTRRRKKKKEEEEKKDEVQAVEHADVLSHFHLLDRNQGPGTCCKLPANEYVEESSSSAKALSSSNVGRDKESPLNFHCHEQTVYSSEQRGECLPCKSQHIPHPNLMTREVEVCSVQGSTIESSCDVEVAIPLSSSEVKEVDCLSNETGKVTGIAPIVSVKRKLLVLDVNGLLAYIAMPGPKDCKEDIRILGRAIFKRPYCDDFLRFCIQNFDVGIWSSRAKKIIDRVVEYLFGDLQDKLLFCWDMMHSTQTGFKTLENIHKPLVCKELSKIWEPDDSSLPWKKGDYDESNTLLLDDSPYKALLNPLHTAIFPNSYHYGDRNDNSLGPGGDIRVYLEGLLRAENVQKYVSQNPFGQSAINETNMFWNFYSAVLQNLSNRKGSNNTFPSSTSS